MQLTDKQLEEFQELYYKEFWTKISTQEAREQWTKLLNLMEILMKNDWKND